MNRLVLLFPILLLTVHIFSASAVTYPNIIDVEYSQACQKMVDQRDYSVCPTMTELKKSDTSNKNLAGKFFINSNWFIMRDKPQVKNWYQFETKDIICISCGLTFSNPDFTKVIFLTPISSNFTANDLQVTNHTITQYQDYSDNCNVVSLKYNYTLLHNMIRNMQSSSCTVVYSKVTQISISDTPFLPKDSVQWNYNQYLDMAKKASVNNCINGCSIPKNPQHNTGFGWK